MKNVETQHSATWGETKTFSSVQKESETFLAPACDLGEHEEGDILFVQSVICISA